MQDALRKAALVLGLFDSARMQMQQIVVIALVGTR